MDAAGSDIWNSSDQFHFVYQAVRGDVDLVARIDSLVGIHDYTNAGVMIRTSLAADAAHGYTAVSANRGVAYRRRLASGALTSSIYGPQSSAPVWARLVRQGSVVTSYVSDNGSAWTAIGSQTFNFGSTIYVGLAVSSHDALVRTTAEFSNVKVTSLALPGGQASMDIGNPALRGKAAYSGGTYTVNAAGADIWGGADQFHFVYQPLTGNGEITARIASLTNTDAWAKAGVMIREALTADSRHAVSLISAGNGYAFQRRPQPGDYSVHTSGGSGAAPGWVRLVRSGDLFEAYRSADGAKWTRIGSDTIPMTETVYAGLAVTSHNTAVAATAVFDSVVVEGSSASNRNPAVSITAPANGTTYAAPTTVTVSATASDPENRMAAVEFYAGGTLIGRDTTAPYAVSWSVSTPGAYALTAVAQDADGGSATSAAVNVTTSTASLSATSTASLSTTSTASLSGWTAKDIGNPRLAGSSSQSSGVFTIQAAGTDIWNRSDQFHFVYQAVAGDVDIIARVDSLTAVHDYTNAGVMIRAALTADAVHGYTAVTARKGIAYRRRLGVGALTSSLYGPAVGAPVWVRLVRTGSQVTSYTSADGNAWRAVGSQTLALGATAYVGLAVSSHDATTRTTARLSNVRVSKPTQNPTVSITAPANGATYKAPATVTISATASDPENRMAAVEFYAGTMLVGRDTTAPYSVSWSVSTPGIYALTAVATDADGGRATSGAVSVTVNGTTTTTSPRLVAFTASTDHATNVTKYVLKIYSSTANPATATPLATSDLGKPTPDSSRTITVDRQTFFSALRAGSYQATVTAVGPGGQTASSPVSFTR